MALIEVRNLEKIYGDDEVATPALRGVSFSIERGEFIAVMGPSVVIAVLGYSVIKALGRNPSAASKIFMGMIVLLIFVEAISIIAILIIFQLFGR